MKTLYVGTYFNYYNDKNRKKNTLEFCERYPWIHLIQGCYSASDTLPIDNSTVYKVHEVGFIDYILINRWIGDNVGDYNLVIIDTDLIMCHTFKSKIEEKLENYDFVSGFSECHDLLNGKIVGSSPNFYKYGYGHCGYIYGYSNWLLKKMVKFPEMFLIGGFDWWLACCLTGKKLPLVCGYEDIFRNVKYSYIDCLIINNVHRNNLLTNFDLYKCLNEKVILSFMKKRIFV